MSKLPKLKIRLPFADIEEEICDIEQARHRFKYGQEPFLVLLENQVINSYEDLVFLAKQERFRDKKFLNNEIHPVISGG